MHLPIRLAPVELHHTSPRTLSQKAEWEGANNGWRTSVRKGFRKDGARRAGGLEGAVRPPGLVRRMLQPLLGVSSSAREGCVKDRLLGVKIT